MKLLISIGIFVAGAAFGWFYLRKPGVPDDSRYRELVGNRPWRRLGAGICVLLAVMFVLGVYVVDIPERPMPYAIYWAIMLGLVFWVCVLAMKDMKHTRRVVDRWRAESVEDRKRVGPEG